MLTFLTRGAERTALSETTRQATARRSTELLDLARMTPDAALRQLGSAPEGLTAQDVQELTQRFGPNDIRHDRPAPALIQLVKAFGNPFVLILLFLAGVLFLTDVVMADPAEGPDLKGVLTVSVMATISAVLRFWQEYRAGNAAEKLRAMVTTTAAVTRCMSGKPVSGELDIQEIVPGDILTLAAGDMLPADVRFLRTKDLQLNQSMLTGEAMPVEKSAEPLPPAREGTHGEAYDDVDPLNADNLGFMGTSVVSGSGTAVVVATGNRTAFGSLAASLSGTRPETSFDVGIRKVSNTLIRFMLIMVPTVFIINGLTKDWTSAFLFGVTTAVGLTPEMLPLVVTANLAKGANLMAKHRVIVRRLNSIQNLGAMDVLATDKTGTLTEDRIVLEQHLDSMGHSSERTLLFAAVNAHFQTGLRGLLDGAILDSAGDELPRITGSYTLVDEMPFDFARRRLSVVVEDLDGHTVVTKGAVEEVLALCTRELVGRVPGGREAPLSEERRREIEELVAEQNALGLRVLAVAVREIPFTSADQRSAEDLPRTEYTVGDEQDMTLLGFLTFLDPPKTSAGPALASLARNGVAVKVITGDGALVAQKVCADVGLDTGEVVLGQETEALDLKQLGELAERTTLFAKVNPAQKARIIEAMREHGHTVGYLGDGVNDAPALRTADVGISVDTAVDIAKESADIILLDKDLTVLEAGVIEGRRTFVNTMKYIKMTASSNFGNMFSVLVASALLPFLPMIPVVALIQGLAYDISMLTLPWDRVDRKELSRPRVWEAESLSRFMIRIGPLSSIFDVSTYALMWFVFAANTPEHAALFQSGWFVESIISQTLIVHFLRTRKVPFLRSRASLPVLIATLAVCVFGLVLPFTGFGAGLGLVPLPWTYFPWLVLTLAAYCAVVQLAKRLFIRRFGAWI